MSAPCGIYNVVVNKFRFAGGYRALPSWHPQHSGFCHHDKHKIMCFKKYCKRISWGDSVDKMWECCGFLLKKKECYLNQWFAKKRSSSTPSLFLSPIFLFLMSI
jgi:hypothetical protein